MNSKQDEGRLPRFITEATRDGRKLPKPTDDTVRRAQKGDRQAINELIRFNMRIVRKVAGKYTAYMAYDDLIQEGVMGLLVAIQKFDLRRTNTFLTYAIWWIRAHISRACAKATGYKKVGLKTINAGIPQENLVSLSQPYGNADDPDCTIEDILADPSASPEQVLIKKQLRQQVTDEALRLCRDDREVSVVERLASGVKKTEKITLEEIGDEYGVTRERIRQIESGVKKKGRASEKLQALAIDLRDCV